MTHNKTNQIQFLAEKVHVHYWPLDKPKWSESRIKKVNEELNTKKGSKKIRIQKNHIFIDEYEFDEIKKVGVSVPFFKKQCTMIFEGHCQEFYAHIHITTKEKNYLEIFNNLMSWKQENFEEDH